MGKKIHLPCAITTQGLSTVLLITIFVLSLVFALLPIFNSPSLISTIFAKSKTSKLKRLTAVAGFEPVYSTDGEYIVYSKSNGDGTNGQLYRKKASSKSKGSAITDDKAANPAYSPDGTYIVYVNVEKDNKLYRKRSDEYSDG